MSETIIEIPRIALELHRLTGCEDRNLHVIRFEISEKGSRAIATNGHVMGIIEWTTVGDCVKYIDTREAKDALKGASKDQSEVWCLRDDYLFCPNGSQVPVASGKEEEIFTSLESWNQVVPAKIRDDDRSDRASHIYLNFQDVIMLSQLFSKCGVKSVDDASFRFQVEDPMSPVRLDFLPESRLWECTFIWMSCRAPHG